MTKKVWLKAGLYTLASLTILVAILLSSLSFIAKYATEHILSGMDLENPRIEEIDFQIFSGKASLLSLRANKNSTQGLNIADFDIDFEWKPLLKNKVIINSLTVNDLIINVQQTADGEYKIGLEPESKPAPPTETAKETAPWDIEVNRLTLQNIQINIHSADSSAVISTKLDFNISDVSASTTGNLRIGKLALDNLQMKLNQADSAEWSNLSFDKFEYQDGNLSFEQFTLANLHLIALQEQENRSSTLPILFTFINNEIPAYTPTENAKAEFKTSFSIGNFTLLETGKISSGYVKLENTSLILNDSRNLSWKSIMLSELEQAGSNVSLEKLHIQELYSNITLNKDRQLQALVAIDPFLKTLEASSSSKPSNSEPSKPETSNPETKDSTEQTATKETAAQSSHWRLGQFTMDDNSALELHDLSVEPKLEKDLTLEINLGQIDSEKPEGETDISLLIESDTHEEITLTGTASPLLEKPNADLNLKITHIDLTNFSNYSRQAIGYDITSGLLDLKTDAKVTQGKLKSTNKITLNKFHINVGNEEKATKFNNAIQLPLDTSLNIIREKGDIISLEIPINGDLENPEFEIRKVVNKAISKSLKTATVTYLQYAIQPWGAALFVGKKLSKAMNAIEFEPIKFASGEAELSEETKKYLTKLSELLQKKESLSITACPVTSADDKAALQQAQPDEDISKLLKGLAKSRLNNVKGLLVEQGVKPSQVVNCLARHSEKDAGQVKLGL